MGLKWTEARTREHLEAVNKRLTVESVDDPSLIRVAAMAMFTGELEAKLRNLQDGEMIQVVFRVDILTADGKVRGGAGSDRSMPAYADWRKSVYERDGYTCQECGSKKDLHAHHVKHWKDHPDLRFEITNGITLCYVCHSKKHPALKLLKRYGKTSKDKS